MSKIRSILFVCTGNSCRSVMAEALLKKYLKNLGKDYIEVYSAGIAAPEDMPPTDNTVKLLKERDDIDASSFRAKRLTDDLIKKTDLILVMENAHRDEVVRRAPEASSKTYLLKEFEQDSKSYYKEGLYVEDPIGKPLEDYERVYDIIKREVERIAKLL